MSRQLFICSTNPGKLREFELASAGRHTIAPLPGLAAIGAPEETGVTFEENARLKAEYYSRLTRDLVVADDSGLEVDALSGAPGAYSARFAGVGADEQANNRLLLERMRGVNDRAARFVCVLALARASRVLQTFRGTVHGRLLYEPRGTNGFGYDPLFFYPPFGCTLAEAAPEQKLQVSHRGEAIRLMLVYLSATGP